MSGRRPTIEEERALELRAEARGWVKSGLAPPTLVDAIPEGPWMTSSLIPRLIFAVFAAIGISAVYAFFFLLHFPLRGCLTAAAGVALAEFLIRRKRLLHYGEEEVLWLGALLFAISDLPHSGAKEALLLFAAAFLIAGWRVLSEIFVMAAVVLAGVYVQVKSGADGSAGAFFAFAAIAATVAGVRRIRRPWMNRLTEFSAAVLPLIAYVAFAAGDWPALRPGSLATLGVVFAWLTAVAVLKRDRASIAGAMLLGAALGSDLVSRLQLSREAKLAVPGVILLAAALAAERWLRTSRRGVTSRKVSESSDLRFLEMAAATALSASQQPEPAKAAPAPTGQGGEYGGAGASGEY